MKKIFSIALATILITACSQSDYSKEQDMDAFIKIDWSLKKSLHLIENRNEELYEQLRDRYYRDKLGNEIFMNATNMVIYQSDSMVEYIQKIKSDLFKHIDSNQFLDKNDTMLEHIDKKDERTLCSTWLIGEINEGYPQHSTGFANKLKTKLNTYRKKMVELLNKQTSPNGERDTVRLTIGLLPRDVYVPGKGRELWEVYNFDNMPFVTDITTLTKLQLDIRNTEGVFLDYFYTMGLARI
ncbi:MAG TPA: hypothetical protein VNY36_08475 [Bacteroidia bacterium]|jgi:hypothetical protein|nr:hypothetical protein [Bacteroidia bacterium]